ncbi:MAG: hypothetical protein LBJ41_11515 [Treponema sp.]|jgi:hypothetical protein|nr:hypothetical protein [Treponema sp.]
MKNDRHKDAIPEAVLTQVYGQIEAVKTALKPYTLALTPQERRSLLKMGDRSLAFVEKAHDYAHDNPDLVPSYLDIDDFDKDFSDAHGLWRLHTEIHQLDEIVEDTIMVAGSEAYHEAIAVYHNVQAAAKQDIPGAKAVYEELKPHFPGGRKRSSDTDAGTETD